MKTLCGEERKGWEESVTLYYMKCIQGVWSGVVEFEWKGSKDGSGLYWNGMDWIV